MSIFSSGPWWILDNHAREQDLPLHHLPAPLTSLQTWQERASLGAPPRSCRQTHKPLSLQVSPLKNGRQPTRVSQSTHRVSVVYAKGRDS